MYIMKQNKKIVGHIALLFVNIFFGINLSVSKELLDGTLTPIAMNVLRFLFGAVVFWTLSVMKPEKVSNKDLLMLFVGALLGLLGNQIFFIQGLSRTSTIDASIIATTVPIITMILSAMVLKEPLTWVKALGVFTGASGAVYLVLSANGSADFSGNMTGDLLCFMSALSFSAFLVLTKNVTTRYSSVTVMKWMFLFASVLALPFSGPDLAAVRWETLDSNHWLLLGFMLVFATVVPYLLIPVGQKLLRPTTQSMYNYVQPIVAMTIMILVGQNVLTVPKAIAASIVFLGVYIVTRSKSRADVEAELAKKGQVQEKSE